MKCEPHFAHFLVRAISKCSSLIFYFLDVRFSAVSNIFSKIRPRWGMKYKKIYVFSKTSYLENIYLIIVVRFKHENLIFIYALTWPDFWIMFLNDIIRRIYKRKIKNAHFKESRAREENRQPAEKRFYLKKKNKKAT